MHKHILQNWSSASTVILHDLNNRKTLSTLGRKNKRTETQHFKNNLNTESPHAIKLLQFIFKKKIVQKRTPFTWGNLCENFFWVSST